MHTRCYVPLCCLMTMMSLLAATLAPAEPLLLVHGEEATLLTRNELAELPAVQLVTGTPWTTTTDRYHGVTLEALMTVLPTSAARNRVRLVALNDYSVTAPVSKLLAAEATLAYERNGAPMPVRDYGPFWLLFPFSERPELMRQDIRDLSVWQLQRLEFLP